MGSTRSVPATLGLPALTGVCFPHLQCSGSRLLYMEPALRCLRFQFLGIPQKRGLGWACGLCLTRPEQLRQPGAWQVHSPGCRAPSPLRGPNLSFFARQSGACALCLFSGAGLYPRPSRRMSTIQNLRKSLVRNWEPVCSLVGGAVSGAKPTLFPSPLSPASSGGWAGLPPASSSGLARSLCSANGRQCVLAVNFLSLLLSHSLSW